MSTKTLSVIYKEKIAEIPDAIDDAKEVANYHKEALKYAVEEMKGKAKGKSKKTAVAEKDDNGEDKVKKPPTEYQVFVKEYQQVIKEKFPDLPSNQRFGKIAEEWKKRKEEKAGVSPAQAPAPAQHPAASKGAQGGIQHLFDRLHQRWEIHLVQCPGQGPRLRR